MNKKLYTFVLTLYFLTGALGAVDRNEFASSFLQLVAGKRSAFESQGYKISDKKGVLYLEKKDEYGTKMQYVFDKKNWYMGYELDSEVSTVKATVGMYFRNNGAAIMGTSFFVDQFGGPSSQSSEIAFLEYPCAVVKGETCNPRDVTAEIFPMLTPDYFVQGDAGAQTAFADRAGSKLVRFFIPRSGTSITASLWLDGAKGEAAVLAQDKKNLRNTECSVTWVKKKEKFEVGKCSKKFGASLYYGN